MTRRRRSRLWLLCALGLWTCADCREIRQWKQEHESQP